MVSTVLHCWDTGQNRMHTYKLYHASFCATSLSVAPQSSEFMSHTQESKNTHKVQNVIHITNPQDLAVVNSIYFIWGGGSIFYFC